MHNYHDAHDHSHTHADGTVHTHSHENEHDHKHEHGADKGELAETRALLNYMLEHNEHHTEELEEISDRLKEFDLCAEAEMLDLCIGHYKKGNEMLEKALLSINE